MKARIRSLLAEVGFSGLEAEVYLALLKEPGATGYRVSAIIGKPAPNTYKALDSLRVKGAVLLDETVGAKAYSALPIGEYLDGLKRNLETRQQEIESELSELTVEPVETGIFKLTSVDQVYSRARSMIESARNVVLLDVFPAPLARLLPDIRRAARRGVNVFIKAYEHVEIKGCDVVAPKKGRPADLGIWNGDWLNVVVDCREYLMSFLKSESSGVHEAVWTRNAYLAVLSYNGVLHELVLTRVGQLIWADKSKQEIRSAVADLGKRYLSEAPWQNAIPDSWKRTCAPKPDRPKGARGRGRSGATGRRKKGSKREQSG